jgi:hypothetical protein
MGSASMGSASMGSASMGSASMGNASMVGVGGVGMGVPMSSMHQASMSITPDNLRRYNQMFGTYDKEGSGYIPGDVARGVLMKSDLDQLTLRKIWELSDVDKDGRLSSDEFSIAMFLVERAMKGLAPPMALPPELLPKIPAATPIPRATTFIVSKNSIEDKKKENFDMGRAELERRRKLLQDEEDKLKEEREKKRLAEEEKIRQAKLKEEQMRMAELEKQRQRALEIERERERVIQQAALQREAEMREAEKKRMEEWTKKRMMELENEKKREMEGLTSLKSYHQRLVDELSNVEIEKRTLMTHREQNRLKCEELVKMVEGLRSRQMNEKEMLLLRTGDLSKMRQELSQFELMHRELHHRLSLSSNTSSGSDSQSQLATNHQTLSATVNSLRVTHSQMCNQNEQLVNSINEKKKQLNSINTDTQSLIQSIQLLTQKKQSFIKQQESQMKVYQDMKAKKDEADRRQRAIENAQKQQRALDEEIKRQKEVEETSKKKRREEEKRKALEDEEKRQTLMKKVMNN